VSEVDALVAFLRQQLDTDERLARAATPGPWRYNPNKQWHAPEHLAARTQGEEFVGAGPLDATIGVAATGPADHPQSMVDALHIAEHDPARVLRQAAAMRRIVDRCAEILNAHRFSFVRQAPDAHCGCGQDELDWAEATLRDLVSVFSDRDGYRESWRPV
jgi:hypothetical protein